MRTTLLLSAFFMIILCLTCIGLSKLDIWSPEVVVLEPRAGTKYVAINRWVTMQIRATISDDRAIRSIDIELWGTTETGTFEQTETLYSVEFDQPNTKIVRIDKTVTASIGNIFVLPGYYYVRFVVEDFIGNKRIMWIKIYIAVSSTNKSPNRSVEHHNLPWVWLGDNTLIALCIREIWVEV